jgi:hypothetical protein
LPANTSRCESANPSITVIVCLLDCLIACWNDQGCDFAALLRCKIVEGKGADRSPMYVLRWLDGFPRFDLGRPIGAFWKTRLLATHRGRHRLLGTPCCLRRRISCPVRMLGHWSSGSRSLRRSESSRSDIFTSGDHDILTRKRQLKIY